MSRRRIAPFVKLLIPLVLLVILFAILLTKCSESSPESLEQHSISEGVSYLESLENMDATIVDKHLKELREAEIQSMKDERLEQVRNGEVSIWSLFKDYVFMGDSRTCGLIFGNYLDNSRILASYGGTIADIEYYIPDIEKLNPSYIFVCFGLNDIVQIGWETPEAYAKDYNAILDNLQQQFPDAKIFVNSIFHCYEPAFSTRWEKWREAPEYSAAVGKMCEEAGYYFIANENIDDSMKDYWQEDGIHFISDFYPIWATNIIMEVYDSEFRESENPPA